MTCFDEENRCTEACVVLDGSKPNTEHCSCGTNECTEDTGLYCRFNLQECGKIGPCDNMNGTVSNELNGTSTCTCGDEDCSQENGLYCRSEAFGDKCGSLSPCTITDGSLPNSDECTWYVELFFRGFLAILLQLALVGLMISDSITFEMFYFSLDVWYSVAMMTAPILQGCFASLLLIHAVHFQPVRSMTVLFQTVRSVDVEIMYATPMNFVMQSKFYCQQKTIPVIHWTVA
jgi:hypothetical protein